MVKFEGVSLFPLAGPFTPQANLNVIPAPIAIAIFLIYEKIKIKVIRNLFGGILLNIT